MAADKKLVNLHFPVGGIVRRVAYQQGGGAYSAEDALNVRADSAGVPAGASQASFIRERGGSRPGITKAFDEQLLGTTASAAVCCSGVTLPTTATLAIYLNGTVFATMPVVRTQPIGTAIPDSFRYEGSHSTMFSTVKFSTNTTVAVSGVYRIDCPGPYDSTPFQGRPEMYSLGNSPAPDNIGQVQNCSPVNVYGVNPFFPQWVWEVTP